MTTTVNKYKLNSISDIISKFEIKNSNKRNPLNENGPSSAKYGLMLNENVVDLLSKNCDTSSQIHKTMIIDTGCPSANESAINFPIPSVTNQSKRKMTESKFSHLFELMSWLPLSLLSVTGMGVTCLIAAFALPRAISQLILYPGFRLLFGTLYPAYASYKAIRTKNVKEYVKWMMYWIVFAFFSCIETFTDIFLSWFPFYYEVKVIIVLWLLSPATKGSSTLYRKFVHPMLTKREQEIDEYINQAKEKGYSAVLQLGSKGVNYATSMIMQTAIKTIERLPSARSENDLIYVQNNGHDACDGIVRSFSYDDALNTNYLNTENRNSHDTTDDEEMLLQSDVSEGAARSRALLKRKTVSKKKTKLPMKGRRKIRSEPEFDILID